MPHRKCWRPQFIAQLIDQFIGGGALLGPAAIPLGPLQPVGPALGAVSVGSLWGLARFGVRLKHSTINRHFSALLRPHLNCPQPRPAPPGRQHISEWCASVVECGTPCRFGIGGVKSHSRIGSGVARPPNRVTRRSSAFYAVPGNSVFRSLTTPPKGQKNETSTARAKTNQNVHLHA
jgi:hypothetical protein